MRGTDIGLIFGGGLGVHTPPLLLSYLVDASTASSAQLPGSGGVDYYHATGRGKNGLNPMGLTRKLVSWLFAIAEQSAIILL